MANKAKSIVFVDAGIEAPLQLTAGIAFDAEVLILSPSCDGVAQMTAALQARHHVTAVYIIAHGAPGQIFLGDTELSLATLPQYGDRLRQWTAQTAVADIHFYGCQIAAGDAGSEFLSAIHTLTQANIAASTHRLGHADQGGNWTLDAFWGEVQQRSLLTAEAMASYPGVLADDIGAADPLTPNTPDSDNNTGATNQPGEPLHDTSLAGFPVALQEGANNSLWWKWDANIDGLVNINTRGSAIDTVLAVYSSPIDSTDPTFTFNNLTLVGRNDNAAPGTPTSSLTFNANSTLFYFFAVDGVGTNTGDITIELDTPPSIVPAQIFQVAENGGTPNDGTDNIVNVNGAVQTWKITAGNPDNDGDGVRAFAIDAATGALTVQDDGDLDFEGFSKNYELTVKATDTAGFSDSESVFIQVTNVNEAPSVVNVSVPSAVNEGTPFTLNGKIFDPDINDTQTVTIDWGDGTTSTIDSGSLINVGSGNRTFSATHIYADDKNGTFTQPATIKVNVTDAGGLTGGPVTRTVSVVNVAPEITQTGPINLALDEDTQKSFLLSATDVSPTDTFSWSAGTTSNGTVTPLTSAQDTQLFTYTPNANFNGTETFQIQVDDGDGGVDTIDVNVTVNSVADAPTALNLTSSADTIDEGDTVTLSGNFIDPDIGDTFTVTINWGDGTPNTELTNADLTFNASTNTYFFNTDHQFLTSDDVTVTVTVQDSFGETVSASEAIAISNVNPELNPGNTSIIIDEDTVGELLFTAIDPVDDTFAWSIKTNGANGTAVVSTTDTGATQLVSYTPNADFSGLDQFVVQVDDGDGGIDTANVTVFVAPVNDAPVDLKVTTPTAPVAEGTEIALSGSFVDVDNNATQPSLDDVHSVTVDWGDGTVETFNDTNATIFPGPTNTKTVAFENLKHTYLDEGDGTYTVEVIITDAEGASVSTTREIQVLNVDPVVSPAPETTASPLTTNEDTPVDFTVTATDPGTLDVLTWGVIANPSNGFITFGTSPENGVRNFTYTPNVNFDGTDTFTLQVTDGDGGFADFVYNVTVAPINDAPTIIVNDFNIVEDQVLPVTLSVLDAQDLDGPLPLNFTITGAAAASFIVDGGDTNPADGITFSRQQIIDGKVSFLYKNTANTPPTFTIKAEDANSAFTTAPGNITFTAVDDNPVFVDQDAGTAGVQLGTFTVVEGASELITNTIIKATDEETSDRALSFTVSKVNGGTFLLNGSPTTTFTQGNIDDGLVRFKNDGTETDPSYTITVTDGAGNTATLNGAGTVTPINDAPQITANSFTVVEDQVLQVDTTVLNATDDDNLPSELTFTISGPDAGSFFVDNGAGPVVDNTFTLTELFQGKVTFLYKNAADAGSPDFTVKVSDPGGASDIEVGNVIDFTAVNDAPVLDGNPLTETVEPLVGVTVDEGGIVQVKSTAANPNIGAVDEESGPSNLTFTVSNLEGGDFIVSGVKSATFTQAQVNAGAVFFRHDGTETAPAYTVTVTDGDGLSSPPQTVAGFIGATVNDPPTILVNNFDVVEGEELQVTSSVLDAIDIDAATPAPDIQFTITGADADSFLVNGTPATTFTRSQIVAGEVSFLYNGETAPIFSITANDQDAGGAAEVTVRGNVTFTEVNDTPIFLEPDGAGGFEPSDGVLPTFQLNEEGNVAITSKIIKATDGDFDDRNLTFTVSNVQGGDFFLIGNTTPITEFTQGNINAGQVFFSYNDDDGDEVDPSYDISVTDGVNTATAIGGGTLIPVNDAPVIATNQFDITEGVALTITPDVLNITDVDSLDSEIQIAVAANTGDTTVDAAINAAFSATNFTLADVVAGNVTFFYEGEVEPSFEITVTDTRAVNPTPITLATVDANITFTAVNDAPTLAIATPIAITEDAAIDITDTLFAVTDAEVAAGLQPADDLVYTVDVVSNGSFQLNGVNTTTFTQADVVNNLVDFVHKGEVAPSFTLTLNDSGAPTPESVTKTITQGDFTFTAVNDVPILKNNNLTVTEGKSVTLSTSNLSAIDVETASLDLKFEITGVTNGQFSIDGGNTFILGDITGANAFTLADIIQEQIVFKHDDSAETPTNNAAPSYSVTVIDTGTDAGTGLADATSAPPEPATITFNAINDAPVLNPDSDIPGNAGNDPFAITEGGVLILNDPADGFPGIVVKDPDTPPQQVVFIASNVAGGFFANIADAENPISIFTQAALESQQIVFNHDGTETLPSFTLKVTDGVSSDTENYTATLTTVNDEPTIALNTLTITEDEAVTLTVNDLKATDPETGPANLTYDITNLTNGFFLIDDGAGTITKIETDTAGAFTQQDVIDGNVVFQQGGSNDAPTYTLTVTDDGTGSPGLVAETSLPSDVTVDFTPVNDAPEIDPATTTLGVFSITQGGTTKINAAGDQLVFTDEETTNPALLTYNVDEVNKGTFFLEGVATTTFTQQDLNLGRVTFKHDGSEFAPSYTVTVSDNGVPAPVQSTTLSVDLSGTFINTNNAPVLVKNALTLTEGQTIEFTTSNLSATDSETANLDLVFTVSDIVNGKFTIADNPATPGDESATFGELTFTADSIPQTGGTFTLRDVVEGRVSFAHDGFDVAPAYKVQVTDDDPTDQKSSPIEPATIAFTRVNDDPTLISDVANTDLGLAAFSFTINEDATLAVGLQQIDAADEPGETPQADLSFEVSNVAGGFFALASDTLTEITSFTWVQVENGDIVFNHDGSNVPPTYTLTVFDDEGGSTTADFVGTLVEVNDPPEVTANPLALTEEGTATIDTSILAVTDEESAAADLEYTVDAVTGGEFQLSGTPLTPGVDTFTQADVIAGNVTFVDDGLDDNPPTFSLTLSDGGIEDPANPGTFINQETVTLTDADFGIAANFTSVNDVPFSENGAAMGEFILLPFPTVTEGKSVNITTAIIDMEDEESLDSQLLYTVDTVENGSFQVNGVNKTSFTQADINNNLVTFKHDGSELAPTFTLSLSDQGSPTPNVLTQSVTPTFELANEAPEFTANTLSPIEGQEITLTAANLAASDREDAETLLRFSIDPASVTDNNGTESGGQFFLNGNPLLATDKFSILQINAGLLTFKDDGDEFAPTYEVTVFDADPTAPLSTTEAATIVLDNFQVNDNPTIDVNTFTLSEGEFFVLNEGATENLISSDPETTDPAQLTYTITDLVGGTFLLNGLTATTEFTQLQINNEAIAFQVAKDGTEPSFTITVTDPDGGSTTQAANIAFTEVNDPPVAVDDSGEGFITDEDSAFVTAALTLNDTNEEGTPLTVTELNGGNPLASGALVTLNGNKVSYNPNGKFENLAAGQSTTDTFTYKVTDSDPGGFESDTATVTILINGVNDAPTVVDDLAFTATENQVINLDVLANDSDVDDGDVLTITQISTVGVAGTVTNNGNSLTYDASAAGGDLAAGETRDELFTYTVSDGNGGTAFGNVKVTVTGVNDVPIAVDDSGAGFETADNQSVTTPVLTDNDTDQDGDPLRIIKLNDATVNPTESITLASGATVVLNSGGTVTYTPPAIFKSLSVGQSVDETFNYTITDDQGGESTAAVTITVNGANENPIANDDSGFSTTEGTPIALDVLANDTDIDVKDVLSISSVNTSTITGTVTNNGSSLTYTPSQALRAGEVATETFTYTVSDGNGGSDSASVSVQVTGLNDPPIAVADSGSGFITNEAAAFTTASVLANDSDPEGGPLSVVSINTSGTRGLVTNNGNGTFTYDPNNAFNLLPVGKVRTDTFSYTISDDAGATATATVGITINGLLSTFLDYEQQLQLQTQNPSATAPTDTVDVLPLAQLYDESFYLSRNPDVAALVGPVFSSGYQHFVSAGRFEGRNPSVLFDEGFYRRTNPDVVTAIQNGSVTSGLQHFLQTGHREGRDPSLFFDQSDYLLNNPDVASLVNNGTLASGFQHYILSGVDEARLPNLSLFNEAYYLANNSDVAASGTDPYAHFVLLGQFEGRRPSSLYSESSYLALNPDVAGVVNADPGYTGFQHYQQFGRFEGRFVLPV